MSRGWSPFSLTKQFGFEGDDIGLVCWLTGGTMSRAKVALPCRHVLTVDSPKLDARGRFMTYRRSYSMDYEGGRFLSWGRAKIDTRQNSFANGFPKQTYLGAVKVDRLVANDYMNGEGMFRVATIDGMSREIHVTASAYPMLVGLLPPRPYNFNDDGLYSAKYGDVKTALWCSYRTAYLRERVFDIDVLSNAGVPVELFDPIQLSDERHAGSLLSAERRRLAGWVVCLSAGPVMKAADGVGNRLSDDVLRKYVEMAPDTTIEMCRRAVDIAHLDEDSDTFVGTLVLNVYPRDPDKIVRTLEA